MVRAPYRPPPVQKPHAAKFAELLRHLRADLELNQPTMARHLGVAAKTLSNWEMGFWLPPPKIQFHVLLALRELVPERVSDLAEALGVHYDETDGRRFRGPARASTKGGPSEAELRGHLDPIIWRAAEAMNVSPNDVRAFAVELLLKLDERGAALPTAARAVKKVEPKRAKRR